LRPTEAHTLDWFKEIETYRYGTYAPWMLELMEFDQHAGHDVLEIGGGVGTDLSLRRHGARVTDLDLSAGHLRLAEENFRTPRPAGALRASRRRNPLSMTTRSTSSTATASCITRPTPAMSSRKSAAS
jgi:hypothetical protein